MSRIDAAVAELVAAIQEQIHAGLSAELQTSHPSRLFSVDEAATRLGIGRTKVYGLIDSGELQTFKVGARRLVPESAIAAFVEDSKIVNLPTKSRATRWRRTRGVTQRSKIAYRDGWRCRICREPIEPGLKFPDPGSLSLDHVDPYGSDAEANLAATHLRCNIAKGTRTAGAGAR